MTNNKQESGVEARLRIIEDKLAIYELIASHPPSADMRATPQPRRNANKAPQDDVLFDRELEDLPAELRWREWMLRVEAVIFASAGPPRDAGAGGGKRLQHRFADRRSRRAIS